MRKSRSSGSVGERGGNDPLYPEIYKAHTLYIAETLFEKQHKFTDEKQ